MGSLFPLRSAVEPERGEPRVLRVDEDAADDVFAALGSDTARAILGALYDEPRPASEVADATDTSLQNARYHLEKLVAAELVEVADTWYSERGTEMKVYAPTSDSVVVFAGAEHERSRLRDALRRVLGTAAISLPANAAVLAALSLAKRLLGAFAVIGIVSVLVNYAIAGRVEYPMQTGSRTANPSEELAGREGVVGGGDATFLEALAISPGALFFLGGITAIAVLLAIGYARRRFR